MQFFMVNSTQVGLGLESNNAFGETDSTRDMLSCSALSDTAARHCCHSM